METVALFGFSIQTYFGESEGIEDIFETPKVFTIFSIYIMIFVLQVISAAARNYWKVFPNSTPPGGMNQKYAKIPTMCVLEKKLTKNGTSDYKQICTQHFLKYVTVIHDFLRVNCFVPTVTFRLIIGSKFRSRQ